MRKSIVALILSCGLFGITSVNAADGAKLGYVDIQKVLHKSDAGTTAKEQLAARIAKHEAEKNSKEEDLKKLKADLEKQNIILNESARNAKEKDYQQKLKEYQRFIKDVNDGLQALDEELKNKIIDDTLKVAQEFGRKNGYTFVFVKSEMMMYMDEKADVTDDIIKLVNSKRETK